MTLGEKMRYLREVEGTLRGMSREISQLEVSRLVDDPEGYQNELISDLGAIEDKLDLWLVAGAERFGRDHELHHALLAVARHEDSRTCLVLLGEILENPGLAERLMEVLRPKPGGGTRKTDSRRIEEKKTAGRS